MKIDLTPKLGEIFEWIASNGTFDIAVDELYNIDPVKFNDGYCDEFSDACVDLIPRAFSENQEDYIDELDEVGINYIRCAHSFVNIEGYLYDREALTGVDEIIELPYFKRILKYIQKELLMKNKLKQIIREEIKSILKEDISPNAVFNTIRQLKADLKKIETEYDSIERRKKSFIEKNGDVYRSKKLELRRLHSDMENDSKHDTSSGSGSSYGSDDYYSDNMEKLELYINKYDSKLIEFDANLKALDDKLRSINSQIKSNEVSLKSQFKKK